MGKKVFIAVGHGGGDPGAVGNGFEEKDLNLDIALACRDELTRHGVEVKMDRTTDVELSMSETVGLCNDYGPDLALDIHNNAGGGDGAEVFHHYGGGAGKTLALNILDEVVKIGQNSRGAKTRIGPSGADYYGFIRGTEAPAVIIECAFVDHETDIQIIDTAAERKAMGVAIAKGVLRTLGVAYKAPASQLETPGTLYRVQVGAFSVKANAEKKLRAVKAEGFEDAFVTCVDGKLWRVQVGAFSVKANAERRMAELKEAGFSGYVTTLSGDPVQAPKKTLDEIAKEVIRGDYGDGDEREQRLKAAGYDYDAVQNRVNQLLK